MIYLVIVGEEMDNREQETTVYKLIVLLVLEKIEIPLTEQSIIDICYGKNNWINNYMECKEIIYNLVEVGFIYKTNGNSEEDRYTITYTGRNCLSHFYERINKDLRDQIAEYVKENRTAFKRSQEYVSTIDRNSDGSYTVCLKTRSALIDEPMFELKIKAPSRQSAIGATNIWREKAPLIYENVYETLIDVEE